MSKQLEILQILFRNNKTKSWLQTELKKKGYDVDLQYTLDENRCKRFDVEIYEAIQLIFRENEIIPSENERIKKIRNKVIEINAVIASGLHLLDQTFNESLSDDVLTFDEKMELIKMLENVEAQFARIDELKSFIKK